MSPRGAILVALLAATLIPIAARAAAGQDGRKITEVVRLEGPITEGAASYVEGVVRGSDPASVSGIVLIVNTDGGFLRATERIVTAISTSPVPVAAYVPRGGRAFSAGTIILMSADVAAASRGAAIGAVQPRPAEEKEVSAIAGWVRGLAAAHGRNATAAEEMVRENLVLSTDEALRSGVIDLLAKDPGDLVRELGWSDEVVEVSPDLPAAVLILITDPLNAWLLIMVGALILLLGLTHPTFVGEGTGAALLLMGLYGAGLIGASLASLGVILLGVATMFLELKTGHGVLALAGSAIASAGLFMLYGGAPLIRPGAGAWGAVAVLLATSALVGFYLYKIRESLRFPSAIPSPGDMVGRTGVVKREIPPGGEGVVHVGGELWTARADRGIPAGRRVRIVSVEGFVLKVEEE